MRKWFVYNDIDSRDMGLYIQQMPPIVRPQERAEYATIPGRAGSLTFKEGEHVYDAYEKSVTVYHLREQPLREVFSWLKGSGQLILCNEPDRSYTVDIASEVRFTPIDNDWEQATISFYVQPYSRQYPPELPISLSTVQTVDYVTLSGYVMETYFQLGNTDLLNRPVISEQELAKKGWFDNEEDPPDPDDDTYDWGYATIFSVMYDARTGGSGDRYFKNIILHLTPILEDGSVLTETELISYMTTKLLVTTSIPALLEADVDNLVIWVQEVATPYDGDWEADFAYGDLYDTLLHILQAIYYLPDADEDFPTLSTLREFDSSIQFPRPLPTVPSTANTVINPGNVPALPRWTLPDIDGAVAQIVVNGTPYTFERGEEEFSAVVDSEAEIISNDDGINMDLMDIRNGFPVLQPGENTVSVEGFTDAVIMEPRWRWA